MNKALEWSPDSIKKSINVISNKTEKPFSLHGSAKSDNSFLHFYDRTKCLTKKQKLGDISNDKGGSETKQLTSGDKTKQMTKEVKKMTKVVAKENKWQMGDKTKQMTKGVTK